MGISKYCYMDSKKIQTLAAKVERYLSKTATNFPGPETVYPIVRNVVEANEGNPLMKGFDEVAKPINVDVSTLDARCSIYYQLVFDAGNYERLMNEPDRSQLQELLTVPLTQALQQQFRAYEFRVKVGIVPALD